MGLVLKDAAVAQAGVAGRRVVEAVGHDRRRADIGVGEGEGSCLVNVI